MSLSYVIATSNKLPAVTDISNIGPVPDISLFHSPLNNAKNFCDNEMEVIVEWYDFWHGSTFNESLESLALSYIHFINVYIFIYTFVIFKIIFFF